ncbi:DNA adenine methylase [Acidithiobacillus thiooxidans]|jgi:DNA adenine methylase|uniref:DNA adenine methylase n=1 Tax=Acidithiobacillus thiooxidans TaxID=930 RepID=UPI003563DC04
MPVTDTPLRYPGGKSQLTPLVIELMRENDLFYGEYAEPFAGGAGIAMTLLLNSYVHHLYLNDIDPAIFAFWHSVLNETDALCRLVDEVEVTVEQWELQRKIFASETSTLLERGFATLFLNRTNRSGILKAGVIGGTRQTGTYKIDCRFNRSDLIRKIHRIGKVSCKITLTNLDAVEFLRTVIPKSSKHTLVNLDPPYFGKGPELYTNFYKPEDHAHLAEAVKSLSRRWMLTYDDHDEIRRLYESYPSYNSKLNYSAQLKRIGTELLVLDPQLKAPLSLSENIISAA